MTDRLPPGPDDLAAPGADDSRHRLICAMRCFEGGVGSSFRWTRDSVGCRDKHALFFPARLWLLLGFSYRLAHHLDKLFAHRGMLPNTENLEVLPEVARNILDLHVTNHAVF